MPLGSLLYEYYLLVFNKFLRLSVNSKNASLMVEGKEL